MKMKIFIILNLLGIIVKCEKWYGEITGYDINDETKYAGKSGITITHFYLCGKRPYWVHYKGASSWSFLTYVGCLPAGNGSPIDGICIGVEKGQKYRVKLKSGKWTNEITRCNTINDNSDPTAFAGVLGEEISAVAISGGDIYSVAEGGESSEFEECTKRVVKNLFGFNIKFESYSEKIIYTAGANLVSIQFIKREEFIKDGEITFDIENGIIKRIKWNKKIEKNEMNFEMKKITGYTPIELRLTIEKAYKNGMYNGKVSIMFDFLQNILIIDALSKINATRLIFSGGFRITITLHNNNNNKFMAILAKYPSLYPQKEKMKIKIPNKNPLMTFDQLFKNIIVGGAIIAELVIAYYFGFAVAIILKETLIEIARILA